MFRWTLVPSRGCTLPNVIISNILEFFSPSYSFFISFTLSRSFYSLLYPLLYTSPPSFSLHHCLSMCRSLSLFRISPSSLPVSFRCIRPLVSYLLSYFSAIFYFIVLFPLPSTLSSLFSLLSLSPFPSSSSTSSQPPLICSLSSQLLPFLLPLRLPLPAPLLSPCSSSFPSPSLAFILYPLLPR